MGNRFEHLKSKPIDTTKPKEEFIEGAGNIKNNIKRASKSLSKKKVLLSLSGKMNRVTDCDKKAVLLHLKKDVSYDIEKYCHGNKQGIINYLLRKGLDELIEKGELTLVME